MAATATATATARRLARSWLRSTGLQATVLALLTLSTIAAVGVHSIDSPGAPSIVLLGSGDRLSVWITAGDARMLIASGNDGEAMLNSLNAVRSPFNRRVDLLVLAGSAVDVAAAARARQSLAPRRTFVLDGPMAEHLGDLGLTVADILPSPRRFMLPQGVEVTFDTVRPDAVGAGPAVQEWQALVRHGASIVRIVSSGDALGSLPEPGNVSALVFVGKLGAGKLSTQPSVLAAPASRASAAALAALVPPPGRDTVFAARVRDGEAAIFRFVAEGLRLPASAAPLPSPAAPAATPMADSS